jgi:Carbohydrate esterase, sialic acid-specific acetylesterase
MSRMVFVLKHAIVRLLKQHGYVLLKQNEYEEHNAELTEAASEQAARARRLDQEQRLALRTEIAAKDYPRLEAERAFYSKRVAELEEHNRQLTEAATEHAMRAQALDQDLLALRTEIAAKDYPRLEAEQAFYSKRVAELEEENRHLTESVTKYALRNQKLERLVGGWAPEFEDDDGTIDYAKACGAYVEGTEAPVTEDRLVAPGIANPPGTKVILTFGQSNAANWGEERYAARGAVHVFNIFDMKFYRAIDPLPGASVDTGCVYGGSVWGRLGDRLIHAGFAHSVLFVPIAFGASYVEDWVPGGQCYPRLMLALHRLKRAGITVDLLCWHQGEANANHTSMTADEYRDCFRAMLRGVRQSGVNAQVYVALATLCENDSHPFQNSTEIRLGQKKLVSVRDRVMPGPDLDQIGISHRRDGCHFSASGQELAAQAWFHAITGKPMEN